MATPQILIPVGGNAQALYQEIVNQARRAEQVLRKTPLKLEAKNFGAIKGLVADVDRFDKSLTRMSSVIQTFGQSAAILFGIQNAMVSLVKSTIDVEKKITDIGVVLGKTGSELSTFSDQLFDVAKQTGQTFDIVTRAATEFSRQGLSMEETLRRTKDSLILVRTTGLDVDSAVSSLTATVNSFKNEMLDTTKVVNTFRNVDTAFAVSASDLAQGIQRAGASAADAKVNFNELNALITSLQQNTARGGSVIGNSLKSIFTRVQRSSTLEALEGIGVATKELDGSIRPTIQILTDLANRMDSLSDSQRAQIKETVAGVFQINALSSLLQDLAGGYSVYSEALKVANNTTNEAYVSNEKLNQTLSATLNETLANLTQFAAKIGDTAIAPAIKDLLGSLNAAFASLNSENGGIGADIGKGILEGISSFITGPGALLLAVSVSKITRLVLKGAFDQFKSTLQLGAQNEKILDIQQRVLGVLQSQNPAAQALVQTATSREQLERGILDIINQENRALAYQQNFTRSIATSLVTRGAGARTAADGLLPVGAEAGMIAKGVGGAPSSAKPVVLKGFDFGGGKRGTVVANTSEYIVPGSNGSAIFNQDMVKKYGLPSGAVKLAAGGFVPNMAGGSEDVLFKLLSQYIPGAGKQSLLSKKNESLPLLSNVKAATTKSLIEVSESFADAVNIIDKNKTRIKNAPKLLRDLAIAQGALFREIEGRTLSGEKISPKQLSASRQRAGDALSISTAPQREASQQRATAYATKRAEIERRNAERLERVRLREAQRIQAQEAAEEQRRLAAQQKIVDDENKASIKRARGDKLRNASLYGSIAVPLIGGLASQATSNAGTKDLINGISSAVGTALAGASFGPAGLIAGGAVGAYQATKSISNFQADRRYGTQADEASLSRFQNSSQFNSSTFQTFQQALEKRDEARTSGNAPLQQEALEEISKSLAGIYDPELSKAMYDSIASNKTLAETQKELGKAFKSYQDKITQETESQSVLIETKNLLKERGGFLGSGGIGLQGKDLEDFAKRISNTVSASQLSENQRSQIRSISESSSVGSQDIFSILGLDKMGTLLREGGALSDSLQVLVANFVTGRIESDRFSDSLKYLSSAQIDATKSSNQLIKTFNRITSESQSRRRSEFDITSSAAKERVSTSVISDDVKILASSIIEGSSLTNEALTEAESVINGMSNTLLSKMQASLGGAYSAQDISKQISSNLNGQGITDLISKLSSLENLTQEEKDSQDENLDQLRKIKSNLDVEIQKLDTSIQIQRQQVKNSQLLIRANSLGNKDVIDEIQKKFAAVLKNETPTQTRERSDSVRNAQSATDAASRQAAIVTQRGLEARRRLDLRKAQEDAGFIQPVDYGSAFDSANPKEALKNAETQRKAAAEAILPDIKESLSSDIRNSIISSLETFGKESNLGEQGTKSLNDLIKKIGGTSDVGSLSNISEEFLKQFTGVSNTRASSGSRTGKEVEQLNQNIKATSQVLKPFEKNAKDFDSIAGAVAESKVGGQTPPELTALADISTKMTAQLTPLDSISESARGILSLLQARLSVEAKISSAKEEVASSANSINNARNIVKSLTNPDNKNNFDNQNLIDSEINKAIKGNQYSTYDSSGNEKIIQKLSDSSVETLKSLIGSNLSGERLQSEFPSLFEDLNKSRGQGGNLKGLSKMLIGAKPVNSAFLNGDGTRSDYGSALERARSNEQSAIAQSGYVGKTINARGLDFDKNVMPFASTSTQGNIASKITSLSKLGDGGFNLDANKINSLNQGQDFQQIAQAQSNEVYNQMEAMIKKMSGLLSTSSLEELSNNLKNNLKSATASRGNQANSVIDSTEVETLKTQADKAFKDAVQKSSLELLKVDTTNVDKSIADLEAIFSKGINSQIEQTLGIDISGEVSLGGGTFALSSESVEQIKKIIQQQITDLNKLNGVKAPMVR